MPDASVRKIFLSVALSISITSLFIFSVVVLMILSVEKSFLKRISNIIHRTMLIIQMHATRIAIFYLVISIIVPIYEDSFEFEAL